MIEYVEVLGWTFGYKLLTRRQLRELLQESGEDPLLFEELVCQKCVVDIPIDFPGFDLCPAGIPTTICQAVMQASGYHEDRAPLEQDALDWAMTPQARLDVLICFCFPGITLDKLDDMDPRTYYRYAAASQLIIGGVYGMDAGAFLDPSRDGRPPGRAPGAAPPPQGAPQQSPYVIQ